MSGEPFRLALVGAGAIAQAYVEAITESTVTRLVAVADVRGDVARAVAEPVGCASYDDHRHLLAEVECDGVLVCTPPVSHPQVCRDAIERGRPVLCEKPLCIGRDNARALVQAADEAGVLLTMASKFRYVEDVIRAKSIVASGILGDVVLFENTFASRVQMGTRWNADPAVAGGGVLIDNGTHSVDLLRYLIGPISEVYAVAGKKVQQLEVEDTVRLSARCADGVLGSIDLSWSLAKEHDTFIDVYGSRGTVRVGWKASSYRQTGNTDWVVFGQGYRKVQALRRNVENFCRAVRGEETLLITGRDAIASVAVIEAAYESLRQDRWVTVS